MIWIQKSFCVGLLFMILYGTKLHIFSNFALNKPKYS